MSDKKYPYIGQLNGTEFKVLFVKPNTGTQLSVNIYSDDWCEDDYKNITPEYLSNTWGVVESKEHAEFIIEMAELHEIGVWNEYNDADGYFIISGDEIIFTEPTPIITDKHKQITIPLPPTKIETTSSVSKVNRDIERDIAPTATKEEEFEMTQIEKNNGDNLLFGDADKCKEWPCVSDEVKTNFGKGVIKLSPDLKGCYVIEIDGNYHQLKRNELSKPKTPEEELRDELGLYLCDKYRFITTPESLEITDTLLSKYNITKKPQ